MAGAQLQQQQPPFALADPYAFPEDWQMPQASVEAAASADPSQTVGDTMRALGQALAQNYVANGGVIPQVVIQPSPGTVDLTLKRSAAPGTFGPFKHTRRSRSSPLDGVKVEDKEGDLSSEEAEEEEPRDGTGHASPLGGLPASAKPVGS